jgi:hypothetical protein
MASDVNSMKNKKTPRELVNDVAEIPDEIATQLPYWARVLRDLCREAIAQVEPDK